ncbi:MAG TPA: Ni/Fe-hydrogenase, b-type cytochrome subunit [Gemmatimonadales bacterium]|nr:Ni/Fe-hydrogenase, b-type cytochrome subunit [Gemmatimonadales bacterium]
MTTMQAEHLPRTGNFRWVTLWGVPLRVMHWVAAFSILVLAVTGLYIGKPYFMTSGEASSHYLMGWVRFAHFAAAGVLVMTAIVRVYWLFAGNRYERWKALIPYHPRDIRNLFRQARAYLLVRPEEAPPYLGHNPLQQLSYTMLYAVALVQVVTGFAMYGQYDASSIFYRAFNWIGPLMGGMPNVRFIHHVLTWVFAIYVPIHVYMSIRADVLEHNSTISSIVSGGRMVPPDQEFEDD